MSSQILIPERAIEQRLSRQDAGGIGSAETALFNAGSPASLSLGPSANRLLSRLSWFPAQEGVVEASNCSHGR
jgi:hypothetical protein